MLSDVRSRLPAILANGLTAIGLFAMILDTSPATTDAWHLIFLGAVVAVWSAILAELVIRLHRHATWQQRFTYLATSEGAIDLASVLALPFGWLVVSDPRDASLFALVWSLRFIRHTTGLTLFVRVMMRCRVSLLSIASLFGAIFFGASTLAYIFERHAQPETFGSVGRAMWWAVVTLTTTGYGDLIPLTIWGRLLAGWVMIGGIVMFALQAGIIATAFAEELRRQHFLRTWDLVVTMPLFQKLGAATVADIVRRLEVRDVAAGAVIVREGEPGDTMYFVVSGEATVELEHAPVILKPGSFFGEMTLLFGTPRSATVVATQPSVLLVLDIADLRELAARRPELVDLIEREATRRRDANAMMRSPASADVT